jgi:hypothetical protein
MLLLLLLCPLSHLLLQEPAPRLTQVPLLLVLVLPLVLQPALLLAAVVAAPQHR